MGPAGLQGVCQDEGDVRKKANQSPSGQAAPWVRGALFGDHPELPTVSSWSMSSVNAGHSTSGLTDLGDEVSALVVTTARLGSSYGASRTEVGNLAGTYEGTATLLFSP